MTAQKTSSKKKSTKQLKLEKLQEELKKTKIDLQEKKEKFLRTCADLQNYQKRIEREYSLKDEEFKKKYLTKLLDLHELIKKAYEDKNPQEGLRLIIQNLESFFKKEHISGIDCIGKKFDHNFHHAVTTVKKKDIDDDTIIEEVKKGYMLGEKLLRPSQVIVVQNKEEK